MSSLQLPLITLKCNDCGQVFELHPNNLSIKDIEINLYFCPSCRSDNLKEINRMYMRGVS